MSIYIIYYKSTKVRVKFNKISIKNISFKFEMFKKTSLHVNSCILDSLFWSFRHYRTLDSLLVSHQWWSLENHTIRFGSMILSLELSLQSKSRLGFQIKGVTLKLLCWPRTCWKDSIVDLGLFNPNPYHASDTKYRSVACGYTNRT